MGAPVISLMVFTNPGDGCPGGLPLDFELLAQCQPGFHALAFVEGLDQASPGIAFADEPVFTVADFFHGRPPSLGY